MIFLTLAAAAGVLIGPARPITPKERIVVTEAVKAELVDPASATIKFVPVNGKTVHYCASVNSKNRMGGFAGPKTFVAAVERDAADKIVGIRQVMFIEPDNYSVFTETMREMCTKQGYAPIG